MAAVNRREVDAVVVTKLDCIALVVLDEAIGTSTLTGRLLFNVLGAIAEFERGLVRERKIAGLVAARRRGRHPGRPPALDRRKRDRVHRLRRAGHSIRVIAARVGASKGAVARELAKIGGQ